MAVKLISIAALLGLLNLFPLGMPLAYGAHGYVANNAGYGQRVQFRPWGAPARQMRAAPRWRPERGGYAPRALTRPTSPPPVTTTPPWQARPLVKPAPAVNRVARPDPRFRPDTRRGSSSLSHAPSPMQSQFRPARQQRKPTYEQMVASGAAPRYPYARGGYRLPPTMYAPRWYAR